MGWREQLQKLPLLAPTEFELDPRRTGLVIIDMQYLDAHRDYGLGASLKERYPEIWKYYFDRVDNLVVPNIRLLLEEFRRRSMFVIHVTLGPVLADGADMVRLRRPRNAEGLRPLLHPVGSFEHGILSDLTPIEGEIVVNKTSRAAFNSTAMERLLLNLELETLFFVGVTTSACVDTTARDAADRGFKAVIIEDATAELDEFSHNASLLQFSMRWGRVWTSKEAVELLSNAGISSKKSLATT